MLPPDRVAEALERIAPYIVRTPLLTSQRLDNWLGHTITFKAEPFQKVGAFKVRGALNAILKLKEQDALPRKIVAYSSGNHAQAVAWAAKEVGVPADIYLPEFVSTVKKQATRGYGATVIETPTRKEAEELVAIAVEKEGAVSIPPFDNDEVILGQATAALEALQDMPQLPQAIFAPCGGGGLLSGTYLAAQYIDPSIKVIGGEPQNANDAARSLQSGSLFAFDASPETIADGARTLCVAERTLAYLKKLEGFYEVSEEEILYWTQWLTHLLKITCEPTSAVAMAAAAQWLKTQEKPQHILVIVSGGNIAPAARLKIWQQNLLEQVPS
jgi:threonine dehydratase